MKKFLKIFGIILLIIIVFLIFHTIRNIIIIKNITNKVESYKEKTNYYVKSISTQGIVIENFNKDGRLLLIMVHTSETGIRKMMRYSDENVINTYIEVETETGVEKIASLNSNSLPSFQGLTNWLHTDNAGQLLLMALLTHIRSVEQNGKDCYEITYVYSSNILMPAEGDFVLYIEKETGLTIKNRNGTFIDANGNEIPIIVDYEYKFDIVTDDDLKEPDISEYTIQGNN